MFTNLVNIGQVSKQRVPERSTRCGERGCDKPTSLQPGPTKGGFPPGSTTVFSHIHSRIFSLSRPPDAFSSSNPAPYPRMTGWIGPVL